MSDSEVGIEKGSSIVKNETKALPIIVGDKTKQQANGTRNHTIINTPTEYVNRMVRVTRNENVHKG